MRSHILKFILITNYTATIGMEYTFHNDNTKQQNLEQEDINKETNYYTEIILDINEDKITKSNSQSLKNKQLLDKIKKAIKEKDLAMIILLMHNNEMKNLQEFIKKIQLNKQEQEAINNINIKRSRMWNICQTTTTIIFMGILVAITQLIPKYAP